MHAFAHTQRNACTQINKHANYGTVCRCFEAWLVGPEACWLGLRPGWLGVFWLGQRASWLGLMPGWLGLRPGWLGLRLGGLGLAGWV